MRAMLLLSGIPRSKGSLPITSCISREYDSGPTLSTVLRDLGSATVLWD